MYIYYTKYVPNKLNKSCKNNLFILEFRRILNIQLAQLLIIFGKAGTL